MIGKLKEQLSKTINWNKSRIDFLAKFLIALFVAKTVNLSEIASVFIGTAKESSNYKRLQRFFRSYSIKHSEIVTLLMSFFSLENCKLKLALDRTNWKYGKVNINILTLAIIYKEIAFPIFWKLLNKRGNSNTDERIEIMKNFINIFGISRIDYLLADREFIGKDWISFLKKEKISFIIRIKQNTLIPNYRGINKNAKCFFYGLKNEQRIILPKQRIIFGESVYVAGCRLKSKGLLIVITDKEPENAIEEYAKRWNIETLFGFLKTKGFCLEDTHLTNPIRISKLFSLLAIAFCWSYTIGEVLSQKAPIKIKTHHRKAISIFKLGFRFIRKTLISSDNMKKNIKFLFEYLFKWHNVSNNVLY